MSQERHILALSGGKDSAALAVYMREEYPEIPLEYVFIDSGCELPETYEYIQRLRAILNIQIIRIGGATKGDRRDFTWWLKQKNYYLPSPKNRWCTIVLKLIPYAQWLRENFADCIVHSYVGLRADEKRSRKGYIPNLKTMVTRHPFIQDGLVYSDIKHLLISSGLGFPAYHKWRSRSGCFFCFYQTKREWIGLYDHHEDLYWKAAEMEKIDQLSGKKYTWCDNLSLKELLDKRKDIDMTNDFVYGDDKCPKLIDTLPSQCLSENINIRSFIRRDYK